MDSLEYICNRIKDIKVLTKEEVSILIKRYRAGDEDARETLVLHNIRLVMSLATQFVRKYHIEYDDIIAYGVMGIYKAINKFDPGLGYTFATYAHGWIMQAMHRHCIQKQDLVNSYKGRERFNFKSIDDDDRWDGRDTCISVEYEQREVFMKGVITEYLDTLPERERLLIRLKFGFDTDRGDMPLRDVGEKVGLSGERVRQIIAEQTRKMKRNKKLRELIGRQ